MNDGMAPAAFAINNAPVRVEHATEEITTVSAMAHNNVDISTPSDGGKAIID
eukprot:SAG11_NODE_1379_length_5083_cov_3.259831_5_plen_51_part_01